MKRRAWQVGVIAALLATAAHRAAAEQLPGPVVGRPAPPFSLVTTAGTRVSLSDYRGKTLVVNVWGSWCPPCRLETPDLIAEANAGAAHGVAFLGVDTTEPAPVVRAFAAAKGVPYPQAVTTGTGAFARAYDVRNFPTTFVIDPRGVLRARHADNVLPRAQLRAYIAAAQRGASAPLVSSFQRALDALLDPAKTPFGGTGDAIRSARDAAAEIDRANELLDEAMNDPSRDHDLVATQQREERVRAAAIAALAPVARSTRDRALLARMRGDEFAALGRWAAADTAYAAALAFDPQDQAALAGQAYAAAKRGDDARVAAIDARIAALAPSAPSFVALGRAYGRLGRAADAERAFERARRLAAGHPATLAWTNLYAGRTEAAENEPGKARAAFARAAAAAAAVPASDPRAAWYAEQAQEGTIALGIAANAAPALSLAPWSGPDLPGSIASTIKYRLAIAGPRGAQIGLAARGLPPRWIGSFCTDRVCAPFRTTVRVPADGVKIVEFQVVPPGPRAGGANVWVDALRGGRRVASVRAFVRV